jgi:hypothetical protein
MIDGSKGCSKELPDKLGQPSARKVRSEPFVVELMRQYDGNSFNSGVHMDDYDSVRLELSATVPGDC